MRACGFVRACLWGKRCIWRLVKLRQRVCPCFEKKNHTCWPSVQQRRPAGVGAWLRISRNVKGGGQKLGVVAAGWWIVIAKANLRHVYVMVRKQTCTKRTWELAPSYTVFSAWVANLLIIHTEKHLFRKNVKQWNKNTLGWLVKKINQNTGMTNTNDHEKCHIWAFWRKRCPGHSASVSCGMSWCQRVGVWEWTDFMRGITTVPTRNMTVYIPQTKLHHFAPSRRLETHRVHEEISWETGPPSHQCFSWHYLLPIKLCQLWGWETGD